MRIGGHPGLREHLATAFTELTKAEVTGTVGNGLVTVTLRGSAELIRLTVDPTVVDQGCTRHLGDIRIPPCRDAVVTGTQYVTVLMDVFGRGAVEALS